MSSCLSSFLDFKTISSSQIEILFSFAESLKKTARAPRHQGESIILAFFEASTRTRLSFEVACNRAGVAPVLFDGGMKTSLEKGETIEDSILNMAAMAPSALVIRSSDSLNLSQISQRISVPVINAGWGIQAHPTQAFLDLLTLRAKWKTLSGKKLLIVGDVKHSRVAGSHVELAEKVGVQLGQCGPEGFLSSDKKFRTFQNLSEGLRWADAVMALRFQFERHDSSVQFSKDDYRKQFGLSLEKLGDLRPSGWILHPGPINHGIEMETEVLKDSRSCVLEQVHNGVFVREAIVRTILGESP